MVRTGHGKEKDGAVTDGDVRISNFVNRVPVRRRLFAQTLNPLRGGHEGVEGPCKYVLGVVTAGE